MSQKDKSNKEDFFEQNLIQIIIGVILLIFIVVLFYNLYLKNDKPQNKIFPFIPFYVHRKQ
jgi:hypothetical protein